MFIHRGFFDNHRVSDSRSMIREGYHRTNRFSTSVISSGCGTSVFISHKHSDLEDLEGLLGFLRMHYNAIPYLDCLDDEMPIETCAATADRIKQVIEFCPKFILLATEDALSSRWCNWEVGIADKWKLPTCDMAIFPLLDRGVKQEDYDGNEYLQLYPFIDLVKSDDGMGSNFIVRFPEQSGRKSVWLRDWFNNVLLG